MPLPSHYRTIADIPLIKQQIVELSIDEKIFLQRLKPKTCI